MSRSSSFEVQVYMTVNMCWGGGQPVNIYFSFLKKKAIPYYEIFLKTLVSKHLFHFSKPHKGTCFSAKTLWPYINQSLHWVSSWALFSSMCFLSLNKPPRWYSYKDIHAIQCQLLHKLYQEQHLSEEIENQKRPLPLSYTSYVHILYKFY